MTPQRRGTGKRGTGQRGTGQRGPQATHQPCPEDPAGGSHHLIPKAGVMTCQYCGKTQAELEGR